MATRKYTLTPEAHSQIVAFIRAGSFPRVAAEAAGIPGCVFLQWLARGNPLNRPRGWRRHPVFTPLWHGVMEATAIARAAAEVAAHGKAALRWLTQGPGKEQPDAVGWSHPIRPRPAPERSETGWLLDPEMQALLKDLLEALGPYPEAREAAAQALGEHGVRPRRRGKRKPEQGEPSGGGGESEASRGPGGGLPADDEFWGSPDLLPKGDVDDAAVTPPAPPPPADPARGEAPEETPAGPRDQGPAEVS
jgi:hypothetical protein